MAASEVSGRSSRDGGTGRLWPPVALFCVVALLAAGALQLLAGWAGFHPQAWGLVQFGPSVAVLVVLLGCVGATTVLGWPLTVLPLRELAAPLLAVVPLALLGADGWVFASGWVLAAIAWVLPDRRSHRRTATGADSSVGAPAAGARFSEGTRSRGGAVVPRGVSRAVVAVAVVAVAVVAAVLSSPGTAAGAATASPEQQIRRQLEVSRVPAASYAVVDDGQVRAGGWGRGVDEHTPFVIGSLTKTFTALAVAQLADRGAVDLDAPVTRYLPEFGTADPDAVITVRHLLEQTSGLPTSAGLDAYADPQLSLRERVAGAAGVELVSRPGEAFHYCNLNYAVLGLLVEQVSGRSFGDQVAQEVLAPLGMTHSHVRLADAVADGMPDGSTVWFGASVPRETRWIDSALADGYLVSTARDMAAYLQFQLGDGTWQGRRILSEAGLRTLHAPAVPTPPDAAAPFTAHYGLGWGVGSIGGQDLVAHTGDETGYHADAGLLPDTRQALVVLTARNGVLTDPSSAYRAGLGALAGLPVADPSAAFVWTYGVVDAVAVVAVVAMVLALWRRRRWAASLPGKAARRGRWWSLAPTVLADVLLGVALYLGVFVGVGALTVGGPIPFLALFGSAPDLVSLALAGIAFSAVKAVLDLGLGLTALRRGADRAPERVPSAGLVRAPSQEPR